MAWYEHRRRLREEGLSAEEIDKHLGSEEPASVGYGRLTQEEMKELDSRGDNRMPHINRATKRARIEAYKAWAADLNISKLADRAPTDID